MKIKDWVSQWMGDEQPKEVDGTDSTQLKEAQWRKAGYSPIHETSEDDIFLVGYPKSGNTWMQNLVAGLMYRINTEYLPDRLTQILVPNLHGFEYYKRIQTPMVFKSHFLPQPEYRRVVYLVRDGRDALVSYYHMLRAEEEQISYHQMVNDGLGVFPCKWHQHVSQWNSNPFAADILWVRYEDLLSDPMKELKRFCEFCRLDRSTSDIQDCIAGNSFEKMKDKEKKFGWNNSEWNPEKSFIRGGRVGDYVAELPADVIQSFERQSGNELELFGYKICQHV